MNCGPRPVGVRGGAPGHRPSASGVCRQSLSCCRRGDGRVRVYWRSLQGTASGGLPAGARLLTCLLSPIDTGDETLVMPHDTLPADSLPLSLGGIWGVIKSQKDLNLPAHKVVRGARWGRAAAGRRRRCVRPSASRRRHVMRACARPRSLPAADHGRRGSLQADQAGPAGGVRGRPGLARP